MYIITTTHIVTYFVCLLGLLVNVVFLWLMTFWTSGQHFIRCWVSAVRISQVFVLYSLANEVSRRVITAPQDFNSLIFQIIKLYIQMFLNSTFQLFVYLFGPPCCRISRDCPYPLQLRLLIFACLRSCFWGVYSGINVHVLNVPFPRSGHLLAEKMVLLTSKLSFRPISISKDFVVYSGCLSLT